MKDVYAITVSTKYDDILGVVIHQNVRFLKKWYIITDPADQATIDVVKTANYPNVELLYYDFYKNAVFNFGGARQYGQIYSVQQNGMGKYTLMLDSDIYLPDNFMEVIDAHDIVPGTLYGVQRRHDYARLSDLRKQEGYTNYQEASNIYGFFQLFVQTPNALSVHSYDCSVTDIVFHNNFAHKDLFAMTLCHLGQSRKHWQGRKSRDDFVCDV